jgi:hypothetical protein
MSTMAKNERRVTVGVDTHLDTHVAVALDQLGRRIDTAVFPADPTGYRALLAWSRAMGAVEAFGPAPRPASRSRATVTSRPSARCEWRAAARCAPASSSPTSSTPW